LSAEERDRLEALVHAGKRPAQLLTRARILVKADVSEAGQGWSDSAISATLDAGVNNAVRTRQPRVEEGFEATLRRKYKPNSARPRIFDGAAEAKRIALTCSPAPDGFARWRLRLLEEKVVELNIVDKASDNARVELMSASTPSMSIFENDGLVDIPPRSEWTRYLRGKHRAHRSSVTEGFPDANAVQHENERVCTRRRPAPGFSIDEKSQFQALDHTPSGLPLKKGRAGTKTRDCARNGTTTLLAVKTAAAHPRVAPTFRGWPERSQQLSPADGSQSANLGYRDLRRGRRRSAPQQPLLKTRLTPLFELAISFPRE
jgi:hypothetical protein